MENEYDKESPYCLLRYKRCSKTELITRVDRYYIIRFWLQNQRRQKEHLFYPSEHGKAEIEEYRYLFNNNLEHQIAIDIDRAKKLVDMLNQLEQFGNANPNIIVTEPVKPFKTNTVVRSAKKLKRSAKKLRRCQIV